MDSPLVTASIDCFQSWPQTIFHCSKHQVRNFRLPTVRRLQCRVFQMTIDVIDIFLLEIQRPILWGASNLHFLGAHSHHHGDLHRQSLADVFQSAGRFDAAKQHRRSIRRLADHSSVQWPLLYGPETVRVPTGNAVKVSPTFFVGVSLPDIFFARRSPLTSAGGHGCYCDRSYNSACLGSDFTLCCRNQRLLHKPRSCGQSQEKTVACLTFCMQL